MESPGFYDHAKGISGKVLSKVTQRLLELYVKQNNMIVRHQTDSFDDFALHKMDQIISSFNPIDINESYLPDRGLYKHRVILSIENPTLLRPTITEKDGQQKIMMPNDARLRNMTYSSQLLVDVAVTARVLNMETNEYQEESCRLTSVSLGKIPIMVRSRYCNLSQQLVPSPYDECRFDYGGYFIISGNEKVIIAQDRIAENKVFVFVSNKPIPYSHVAEVRSVSERRFGIPKTTAVKLSARGNQFGRYIRVNVHHLKHEIPLFILFRALGIESDMSISQHIVADMNDPILNELAGSMDEASAVRTQGDAIAYLARFVYTSSTSTTTTSSSSCPPQPQTLSTSTQAQAQAQPQVSTAPVRPLRPAINKCDLVVSMLEHEFLPHIGTDLKLKAVFLGYMVKKLLRCYLGEWPMDDRDSYVNKRIDTPGILLANLFRQYYAKMIKDMRNLILKDVANWPWRATNKLINVITRNNVYKLIKPTIIESGLKYGLATGNWGVKSSRQRQGVAQVLNRMTYLSTLSHLRRINTPIEKTGKLVQPRKLHPTQWGVICPSETPEGASVGLVKNLAMTTTVTIATSATHILQALADMNVRMFASLFTATSGRQEARIEDIDKTLVFLNGCIIGVHDDPPTLYHNLKRAKRSGFIGVHTGVSWSIVRNEIAVCTEGGRCCRPLYIMDAGGQETRLTSAIAERIMKGDISWSHLVLGVTSSKQQNKNDVCGGGDESIIEYLDVEESNHAMIAVNQASMQEGVRYTHMELDPSLMLGAIAGAIPFSDHNQAPRNTYQSAMGKQAISVYTSNFRHRFDTVGHVLNYPQRPLVSTQISTLLHGNDLPSGINAIVAIATFTGFNQEDSVIMNQSAIERGLFVSTVFKTFREQNNKNHSTGEEEFFCRPDENTVSLKPFNFEKLGPDGFVPEGSFVDSGDVIIGKCMPQKFGSTITNKDTSVVLKSNERGYIDRNCYNDNYFTNVNGDGYTTCKVRLRHERYPTVGDKFSCYTADHEVLTDRGWVYMGDLTLGDKVATLIDGSRLMYQKPVTLQKFAYSGMLYKIETNDISLLVTPNHRMFIKPQGSNLGFHCELAENQLHRTVFYKKNAEEVILSKMKQPEFCYDDATGVPAYMRIPPLHASDKVDNLELDNLDHLNQEEEDLLLSMDTWLKLVGPWIMDPSIFDNYNAVSDEDRQILAFLKTHHHHPNHLPKWVWGLTMEQSAILARSMSAKGSKASNKTIFMTRSTSLADDYQRLCLHAGWACNKIWNGITMCWDLIPLMTREQLEPIVNDLDNNLHYDSLIRSENVVEHDGFVYCCTVPHGQGIIYVRHHGKPCWSGNSRSGQKGTMGMCYHAQDMPFSASGLIPDIIINPHAIPSRMTIGQLMECILGSACVMHGSFGDATPFRGTTVEDIGDLLQKAGHARMGDHVLYNSRTGEQITTSIFMGPTYYQRLKHMVEDKIHCLTASHDVLTALGWKPISQVTTQDEIATLQPGGILKYEHPQEVLFYPEYEGDLYHVHGCCVDLEVTSEHRMFVSRHSDDFKDFNLEPVSCLADTPVWYKATCHWDAKDSIPDVLNVYGINTCKQMDAMLSLLGSYLADGYLSDIGIILYLHDDDVEEVVSKAVNILGYSHTFTSSSRLLIFDVNAVDLWAKMLFNEEESMTATTLAAPKHLPQWIWTLSARQASNLLTGMFMQRKTYYTSSMGLADDVTRLALHAGTAAITKKITQGVWRVSLLEPDVQLSSTGMRVTKYRGPVFCLTVSSEVFYVRRNGKPCWTGNSRSSNGPVVLLTRQPAEGRAREGGLRLGEMEIECQWSHGMLHFLKERFMECSDNYRVFVCRSCGMMATCNPDRKIYSCSACSNITSFAEIRLPYACKLLFQEIQTMAIATKFLIA